MSTNMDINLATADSAQAKPSETDIAIMKARQSIEKIKEAKEGMSKGFVKLTDGETKILWFTGEIEAVEKVFKRKKDDGTEEESKKTQFSYKVLEVDHQEDGIKTWDVSKSWSDQIDNLLMEGFLTLKVKRTGTGTNTKYLISPVVHTTQ